MTYKSLSLVIASLFMVACGGSPGMPAETENTAHSALPTDQYSMANGCYSLLAVAKQAFVRNDGNDNYITDSTDPSAAEAFFMKPAMLGEQIFYSTDKKVLTATGGNVAASATITEDAIWKVDFDNISGNFSFRSDASGESLIVGPNGTLALGIAENDNNLFQFAKTTKACTPYPEMPLSLSGSTFKGQGVDKPALGFADAHSHISVGKHLSVDDSRPSALENVFHGTAIDRLGVAHALDDCEETHGPNGIRDGNNLLSSNPVGTHDTSGWPSFIDWPGSHQLTHQSAYYRWIERSYMAGLRILVNYGTNINALCETANLTYGGTLGTDCNDHRFTMNQTAFTHDIENYIDAQHGGPGKGWFRVVYSPQQAREVINDGKLAVILGLEASQLFDCGVTITAIGETPHCTRESFEQLLDEAYDAGIRQLVPLHDIDNAFAGAGIFGDAANLLNIMNFYDTGGFFSTVDCPTGGEEDYFIAGGAYLAGVPSFGNDPITNILMGTLQGTLPLYNPDKRQCNARGLNDLGQHAYSKFFEKGMVLSIDHAPVLVKRALIDIAAQQNPPYPVISGHGYQGGVRNDDVKDLFKFGGYSYPYKPHGADWVERLHLTKAQYDRAAAEDNTHMLPFAMGLGFDINGFGGYASPRENPDQLVHYPFTLFEGDGWGPQFDRIAPMFIDKLSIPGGRTWDAEIDGSAHFGLIPDFVEEIRLEGGEEAVTAFYNSAEAYIQLWEKVYKGE